MNQLKTMNNQFKKVEIKYQPLDISSGFNSFQFKKFSKLEQVNLELIGYNKTDAKKFLNSLKFTSNLNNLLSLKIHFGINNKCNGRVFQEITELISKLKSLKNLSLSFDKDVIQQEEFTQAEIQSILMDLSRFPPLEQLELIINRNNITCNQIQMFSSFLKRSIHLKKLFIEVDTNLIGPQGLLYFYNSLQNVEELEDLTIQIINNQLPIIISQNLWVTIQQLRELSYFKFQLQNCIVRELEQVDIQFQEQSLSKLKALVLDLQGIKNSNQENLIFKILKNHLNFPQLVQLSIHFGDCNIIDQKGLQILRECLEKMNNLKQFQLNIENYSQIQLEDLEQFFQTIKQFQILDQLTIEKEVDYDLIILQQDEQQEDYIFQLKIGKCKENSTEISKRVEQSIKYFQKLKKLVINIRVNSQYVISSIENSNIEEIELYFGSTNQNFNQLADMFGKLNSNQLHSLKIIVHDQENVEPEIIEKFYLNINKQKKLQNLEYKLGNLIKHRQGIIDHVSELISDNYNSNINIKFKIDIVFEDKQNQISLEKLLKKLSLFQSLKFIINTINYKITLSCEDEYRSFNLSLVFAQDQMGLIESFIFGFYYFINLKLVEVSIINSLFQIISKDYIEKTSLENIKLNEMIDFGEFINVMNTFKDKNFIISSRYQSNMICKLMKPFRQQRILVHNSNTANACLQEYIYPNLLNLNYLRQLKLGGYIEMNDLKIIIPFLSNIECVDICIQQDGDNFDPTFFEFMQLIHLQTLILKIKFSNYQHFNYEYLCQMNIFIKILEKSQYRQSKLNYFNLIVKGLNISKYRYFRQVDDVIQIDKKIFFRLFSRLVCFV